MWQQIVHSKRSWSMAEGVVKVNRSVLVLVVVDMAVGELRSEEKETTWW